jgi:hypothetical protein
LFDEIQRCIITERFAPSGFQKQAMGRGEGEVRRRREGRREERMERLPP